MAHIIALPVQIAWFDDVKINEEGSPAILASMTAILEPSRQSAMALFFQPVVAGAVRAIIMLSSSSLSGMTPF